MNFIRLVAFSALVFFAMATKAQNQSLFSKVSTGQTQIGAMFGPSYLLSPIDGANTSIFLLKGGMVLNDAFTVGAYYGFSVGEPVPNSETDPRLYMDLRMVGAHLEYTLWANKLVHLTFPLRVGAGEIDMDVKEAFAPDDDSYTYTEKNFFMLEPNVHIELNLLEYLRLHGGVGYRWVSNFDYRHLTASDLSTIVAEVGIKVVLNSGKND